MTQLRWQRIRRSAYDPWSSSPSKGSFDAAGAATAAVDQLVRRHEPYRSPTSTRRCSSTSPRRRPPSVSTTTAAGSSTGPSPPPTRADVARRHPRPGAGAGRRAAPALADLRRRPARARRDDRRRAGHHPRRDGRPGAAHPRRSVWSAAPPTRCRRSPRARAPELRGTDRTRRRPAHPPRRRRRAGRVASGVDAALRPQPAEPRGHPVAAGPARAGHRHRDRPRIALAYAADDWRRRIDAVVGRRRRS